MNLLRLHVEIYEVGEGSLEIMWHCVWLALLDSEPASAAKLERLFETPEAAKP